MSDTSGEHLARRVRRACGPYNDPNDPELPVVQIVLDLKEKADRLAQIERGVRQIANRLAGDRNYTRGEAVEDLRAIIDAPDAGGDT